MQALELLIGQKLPSMTHLLTDFLLHQLVRPAINLKPSVKLVAPFRALWPVAPDYDRVAPYKQIFQIAGCVSQKESSSGGNPLRNHLEK